MKDKKVQQLITRETKRASKVINLIASENIISDDVRFALGSGFGNKYAEGYPKKRYYKGNDVIDEIEILAQTRALELFGLSQKKWSVNVQAYSGSPANLAVLSALVPVGEKIMGMRLDHGGHLTHGHRVSFTGKLWKQIPYGVSKENERIDMEEIDWIAQEHRPNMIIAGYTAYSRKVDWKGFRQIADKIGAILFVDMSHVAGLVAGGVYPSPFRYADVVMTTTHKTLRGPRGAIIFSRRDKKNIPEKIDKAVFPGLQGGPHEHTIAGIAVALSEAKSPKFKRYAEQVLQNSHTLAEELRRLGWRVISGGTDSHLFLVDTWMEGRGMTGKEASEKLERAGIVVNMNTIPFDTRAPLDPSGIRIGTAYETSRGKSTKDMIKIAQKIDYTLRHGR